MLNIEFRNNPPGSPDPSDAPGVQMFAPVRARETVRPLSGFRHIIPCMLVWTSSKGHGLVGRRRMTRREWEYAQSVAMFIHSKVKDQSRYASPANLSTTELV